MRAVVAYLGRLTPNERETVALECEDQFTFHPQSNKSRGQVKQLEGNIKQVRLRVATPLLGTALCSLCAGCVSPHSHPSPALAARPVVLALCNGTALVPPCVSFA